jgi:hypothetical protein
VPGRVGEKRTTGAAGALGSNVDGTEITGESIDEAADGDADIAAGASSVFVRVSDGEGAGLFVELQPGFAKIRIRANTWMPTTTPKILRIFMGEIVGRLQE